MPGLFFLTQLNLSYTRVKNSLYFIIRTTIKFLYSYVYNSFFLEQKKKKEYMVRKRKGVEEMSRWMMFLDYWYHMLGSCQIVVLESKKTCHKLVTHRGWKVESWNGGCFTNRNYIRPMVFSFAYCFLIALHRKDILELWMLV